MKILLISPRLYTYSKMIINYLENLNHEVTWIYDSIMLNNCEKVYNKLNKKYGKKKFDKYFENEISKCSNVKFDKIVLIFGDKYFSSKNVNLLKNTFPQAKTIFYSWDSVNNFPNIKEYYSYFDIVYSFDKEDCQKYNMVFRPLFYTDDKDYSNVKIDQDIVGLMTYNYKKKNALKSTLEALPSSVSVNLFLLIQNKFVYFVNKFITHRDAFSFIDKGFVKFKGLGVTEGKNFFASAKVVVDCPLDDQNGLTIRTFEVLKMNKKLITTNSSIKGYDFYNEKNIFVVDKENNKVPIGFINEPFDINYKISDYYSFQEFMKTIFEL